MSNERFSISEMSYNSVSPVFKYLTKARYGEDWHSNQHTHPLTEILFVTSGTGEFKLGDRSINIYRGDLIIINPNVMHTETSTHDNPLEYIILGIDNVHFESLDFLGTWAILDENEYISDPPPPKNVFHMLHKFTEINELLRRMHEELTVKADFYESAVTDILSIFIILIMRNASIIATHKLIPKMSRECALVKRYIDSHFSYDLSLDELANKIFVSKFHLIHIFKKYLGLPPLNYILEKRMNEAKKLLENTDLRVCDICKEVGFSNTNHFTQMFKRKEACTPTEFRKKKLSANKR